MMYTVFVPVVLVKYFLPTCMYVDWLPIMQRNTSIYDQNSVSFNCAGETPPPVIHVVCPPVVKASHPSYDARVRSVYPCDAYIFTLFAHVKHLLL